MELVDWSENVKGRHHSEDNIITNLTGMGWKGVDWMQLAQDRDQWQALVNTVMNLRVPRILNLVARWR
jgi:hypothetical protein